MCDFIYKKILRYEKCMQFYFGICLLAVDFDQNDVVYLVFSRLVCFLNLNIRNKFQDGGHGDSGKCHSNSQIYVKFLKFRMANLWEYLELFLLLFSTCISFTLHLSN